MLRSKSFSKRSRTRSLPRDLWSSRYLGRPPFLDLGQPLLVFGDDAAHLLEVPPVVGTLGVDLGFDPEHGLYVRRYRNDCSRNR